MRIPHAGYFQNTQQIEWRAPARHLVEIKFDTSSIYYIYYYPILGGILIKGIIVSWLLLPLANYNPTSTTTASLKIAQVAIASLDMYLNNGLWGFLIL